MCVAKRIALRLVEAASELRGVGVFAVYAWVLSRCVLEIGKKKFRRRTMGVTHSVRVKYIIQVGFASRAMCT